MRPTSVLTTITGRDRPGVTAALFAAFAAHDVDVRDVEQIVIRDRLIVAVLLDLQGDPAALRSSVTRTVHALGMECEVAVADEARTIKSSGARRSHVIVLGHPLRPGAIGHIAQRVADRGDSIESVAQLSSDPVTSIELIVRGDDPDDLRSVLVQAADECGVDIAVEPAGLRRRAKRLVLLNLDTTLLADQPVDALAARAGARERADSLTGLPAGEARAVGGRSRPSPGARAFVRTLHRLGFRVGAVSSGFTLATDRLAAELDLDFTAANELEVVDGRLTGRVLGPITDRGGRAQALERFAAACEIPLSQTVAVGDGVEDVDMIAAAGLGIAFSAASPARPAADPVGDRPCLDTVLFVLGIAREDVGEPL